MLRLQVETNYAERADDAHWLGYYLGLIVEKNWLIKNYGPRFIGRGRDPSTRLAVQKRQDSDISKRDSAAYDADTILSKYGYRIGILTTGRFVEFWDGVKDDDLVLMQGQLKGRPAISGNALTLTTPRGTAKITYATMPETTEPNYIPGPVVHAELELPASFTIDPWERFNQVGLAKEHLLALPR